MELGHSASQRAMQKKTSKKIQKAVTRKKNRKLTVVNECLPLKGVERVLNPNQ